MDYMKKTLIPTIVILVLSAVICILVAKSYSDSKRKEARERLNSSTEQTQSEEISDDAAKTDTPIVDKERLTSNSTCIVIAKNTEDKELTLRNIKGGEDKKLSYDGTTVFSTKHDGPMTASEVMVGDIVDITFNTHDVKLSLVKESDKAWEVKEVRRFSIDSQGKTIIVGDDLYEMASEGVIASGDKVGKLLDVTALDTLTVKGIDKTVYSIQIENGHGYIRVSNDSYFVGGWIEVGQEFITILSENMLIPVPEGSYEIKVTNKGYVGRETLKVKRDQETKLDLSKVEIEEVAIGHVLFTLNPDYAQLYIDGVMTDFEERIPLEYGIHSIRAELAGYETVRTNIRVGSENANILIELDEEEEDTSSSSSSDSSSSSSSDSSSSSSSEQTTTSDAASSSTDIATSSTVTSADTIISDNKQLYIEGPAGCEVYLDGTYIGIAPCSTTKVTGTHTVTLSKSGYETKSYTITVANDGKDLTMSFSDLNAAQ